jgi:hypothetical protein
MARHRIMIRLLFALCVLFFLINVSSQMLLVNINPQFPQPRLGRIYPLNVHGTVVYVTRVERLISGYLTLGLAIFFGAIWVALDRMSKRY